MTTFDNFNGSTQTRRSDKPTLLTDNNQVRKQPVNDIVKLTITPPPSSNGQNPEIIIK